MTNQRRLIIEEVMKGKNHPTAYEVYEAVRESLPHISLGTVYRNLEFLSEKGIINRLDTSGPQRRYDGDMEPHYHIRCLSCGRIDDLPIDPVKRLEEQVGMISNYQVVGHSVEFSGYCPECRNK